MRHTGKRLATRRERITAGALPFAATNAKLCARVNPCLLEDAYVFDAVRTPRGRGKPTGGLHTQHLFRLLLPFWRSSATVIPELIAR